MGTYTWSVCEAHADSHIYGRWVRYVRLGLTKQVSVQTRVGLIFKLAMVLKESKEGQFDVVKLT